MALFSKSEKTMYNRSDMAEKDGHTHLSIYTVSGLLMGTNRFDEKATAPLEDVLQRMQKDGYEILDVKVTAESNQMCIASILYK